MAASPKNLYFFVDNYGDARKFWKDVLQLPIEEENEQLGYISYWFGSCLLEIEELKPFHRNQWNAIAQALPAGINEIPRIKPGHIFRVDVEVDDLDVLRASLIANNIQFTNNNLSDPSNTPYVRVDVSGVFVRLFKLPDNG